MSEVTVYTFLGLPGSGKSYFARNFAEKTSIVRFSSDAMRLSIFGSLEAMKDIYHSENRDQLNRYTFAAMDYATGELLSNGQDVVYDAHCNKRSDRDQLGKLASAHGARVVLVCIETPRDIALHRGMTREATVDQRQLSEDEMREVMDRQTALSDAPGSDEIVVNIDGTIPFEEQFASFEKQLSELES